MINENYGKMFCKKYKVIKMANKTQALILFLRGQQTFSVKG